MNLLEGNGFRSMPKFSLKDIFALASRRKTPRDRMIFFLQGLVFLPFLKLGEMKAGRKNNNEGSSSSVGDDVYPLF